MLQGRAVAIVSAICVVICANSAANAVRSCKKLFNLTCQDEYSTCDSKNFASCGGGLVASKILRCTAADTATQRFGPTLTSGGYDASLSTLVGGGCGMEEEKFPAAGEDGACYWDSVAQRCISTMTGAWMSTERSCVQTKDTPACE